MFLLLLATQFWMQGHQSGEYLGMHYPGSDKIQPHQIVTYMFMHGGIAHLFFNMFALWMFGRVLVVWGSRRFLVYYFVTGLGAALHMLVNHIELSYN